VFSNVAVLIYVFDITSTEWEKDLHYFEDNVTALRENSPEAGVWVLINKMDLVDKDDPKRVKYTDYCEQVRALNARVSADEPAAGALRCFPTSIWDESLYKVRGGRISAGTSTARVTCGTGAWHSAAPRTCRADRRRGRPSSTRSSPTLT
jgi:hypothetical protein